MTNEEKRAELKDKVAAAQARNEERTFADYAREAGDQATSFVKEHPIATVIGGLALGALVASIVPGPGKRLRKKASKRSALLAGALADLAATYGSQFLDGAESAAKSGKRGLADLGDTLGDGASRARHEAGSLADAASRTAAKAVRDLRSRISH